ncbi:MAG: hypothetical protein GY715_16730, partial [Planctomycetes bacterium]|nr:hypothetical protein [Planctomycetota bacterium]
MNCVFSRNTANAFPASGAVVATAGSVTIINCSFSRNAPGGMHFDTSVTSAVVRNTVSWGNAATAISGVTVPDVEHSLIEGGWPGVGNLDADPLFTQAGADNLRLTPESPALDAGDNAAIPPGVETDIDGQPRIQNGTVEMGAYEGFAEALPPAALAGDVDPGETAVLYPDGQNPNATFNTIVAFTNLSDCEDVIVTVVERQGDLHPGAGGYQAADRTLQIITSLEHGQFKATIARPFDADDLHGADPFTFDLTYYDET